MRKWHRRIAPVFAVLLLLMAVTGLAIQTTELLDRVSSTTAAAAASRVPARPSVRSPRTPGDKQRHGWDRWSHWLKRVHSGEAFGPAGVVVNILCGAALLFFAASGLSMYFSMALRRWRRRRRG